MRTDVPGGCMEYDDVGRGRPVVLLHAFPFDRAMWRPQREALQTSYRLILPDLRGFGGSAPFAGPPSLEAMADDVAGLLDALGVREPVVLGGLSMGGYVSLAFARKYGERLRGLILADTKAEADSAEAKANRDHAITFVREQGTAPAVEGMLPKLLSEGTRSGRPAVMDEARRIGSAQAPAGVIGALAAMRDRPDSTALLPRIRVPTLVLVGSEDTLTPPSVAEALVLGLPDGRLAVIQGAGHLANLEQPEAFTAAVGSFLKALP
ncbi:MAG TPA: alpha/beta fold hydrolase [Gemmataceae bacterium]|nr:alpha/beta fold hydrolase [Gemmataceae bacterium]